MDFMPCGSLSQHIVCTHVSVNMWVFDAQLACALQVSELDPVIIQNTVDEFNANSYKLLKSQPSDNVVKCLAAELTAFKEKVPLLVEVRIAETNLQPTQGANVPVAIG